MNIINNPMSPITLGAVAGIITIKISNNIPLTLIVAIVVGVLSSIVYIKFRKPVEEEEAKHPKRSAKFQIISLIAMSLVLLSGLYFFVKYL